VTFGAFGGDHDEHGGSIGIKISALELALEGPGFKDGLDDIQYYTQEELTENFFPIYHDEFYSSTYLNITLSEILIYETYDGQLLTLRELRNFYLNKDSDASEESKLEELYFFDLNGFDTVRDELFERVDIQKIWLSRYGQCYRQIKK
jgi:hypothetical protein